ncbi:hypothetical protein [Legionella nagasakiensis]|uniref:phosphatase domain-containing putative toxin n=1 Tax=Legionella nagasakiensis TaxID=535290 RepID=UPI001056DD65|nr:hypothetical protein [Legionella nagasakiensis]
MDWQSIYPSADLKTYLSALIALLFFPAMGFAADSSPYLVIDQDISAPMPKRFRIINTEGIQVIGSGQFTRSQLINIKKQINAPIIIVDLRQESHGFVDDLPISWYGVKNWGNKGKSALLIQSQQSRLLTTLAKQTNVTLHKILRKNLEDVIEKTQTILYTPETIYDEQQLAKELNLGYKRFYIPDHASPSTAQIKAFRQFVQTIPANTWVYFHCRGGSGRTSTFIVLYDIFKNGKHTSLPQILHNHAQAGGKDLAKLPTKDSYKYPFALQRLNMIKQQHQLAQFAAKQSRDNAL